jgi:hypothetical protein
VPIELIQYAHANKLHKAAGIYLLLKASCDGHIKLSKDDRQEIMEALQIKTVTSFNKYLKRLIQLNWVGFDANTGTYYIRSINYLRRSEGYESRLSVRFDVSTEACTIKEFIQGALVCHVARRKEHGRRAKIIKLAGRPALENESALQGLVNAGKITAYCGLSNSVIGKILGVSKSQADRIKKRLVKLGYIKAYAKYKHITTLSNPDFVLYDLLPPARYQFRIRKKNKRIMVFVRSYDKIISCMEFVNQRWIARKLKMERKQRMGLGNWQKRLH